MAEAARPLFSIVTVCLDAEAHIAEAIESVRTQAFGDYEYLLVDGGSTDGTLDVIRAAEPAFEGRLHWVSEPDDGLYDAMNKAMDLATGGYVEYLGADDRLAPGALAAVAAALETAPRPDIVCGATDVRGPDKDWHEQPTRVIRRGMVQRAPSRHQSIFVRRDLLLAAGGFDPRFRIASDYDLYLRLLEAEATEALIEDTLSEFRLGGVSSANAMDTARDYRDVRVSHGANAAVEQAVMLKSASAATAFALWNRLASSGESKG